MKLLALADVENKGLWDFYEPGKLSGYDLIISCGDLEPAYLEFLVSMSNVPLLYVHGNHDDKYDRKPPLGCTAIEDYIYYYNGLRILGLGGSIRYNNSKNMYSESEMAARIKKVRRWALIMGGIDILVTHAPAKGYGDLEDLPHHGFDCFNDFLEEFKPKYMLHGHVHMNYGRIERERIHTSGTKIINCFDKIELEIGSGEVFDPKERGSALFDLYLKLKKRAQNKR